MTAADPTPAPVDSLGYAAALAELESIVARLGDEGLDIDELADLVGRAADLVARCRERLDSARLRVTEIVADLDESADA